ncbi:MAG: AI-2E family transporter [Deltaproteobacteria bacterium]|nr:AI-2E family transporter [Deltaproteobacteria bacterium]
MQETITKSQGQPSFSMLSKVLVWVMLFALLYVLRSFFLLIFLTFVFAYVQETAVSKLINRIPSRNSCVGIVGLAFLAIIIIACVVLLPQFVKQGEMFVTQIPNYVERIDNKLLSLAEQYPDITHTFFRDKLVANDNNGTKFSSFRTLIGGIFDLGDEKLSKEQLKGYLNAIRNFGGTLASIIGSFLLSLLFAFLILLDLPRLVKTVASLADTKLSFVYHQVSGTIKDFGLVLGRALEAQFFIALCNTALTAIGLICLHLGEKVAFLSVIVFVCSFIPVAGVFISSIPICLFALVDEGATTMLLAIALIAVIHLIEAYILNPRIYGSHMHINPVIVLIILTVGGKLFHAWGLVLGVPICTYVFGHAIHYDKQDEN